MMCIPQSLSRRVCIANPFFWCPLHEQSMKWIALFVALLATLYWFPFAGMQPQIWQNPEMYGTHRGIFVSIWKPPFGYLVAHIDERGYDFVLMPGETISGMKVRSYVSHFKSKGYVKYTHADLCLHGEKFGAKPLDCLQ